MADELKVIVATSAFGMGTKDVCCFIVADLMTIMCGCGCGPGIDKPDVRYVVFYNLPQSMVQFHQGVGRAGRDGQRADGVIFWSYKDKREILNVQKSNGENQPDKYAHPPFFVLSVFAFTFAFAFAIIVFIVSVFSLRSCRCCAGRRARQRSTP
jgi:superfamily II DNA/RNA helicase